MAKPTEDYEWAESNSDPTRVTDPTALRANGFPLQSPFASNAANFLYRALGRWIDWLQALFDNAGNLTFGSTNGLLEVTIDSGAQFEVTCDHLFGGQSRLEANVVTGTTNVTGGTVTATTTAFCETLDAGTVVQSPLFRVEDAAGDRDMDLATTGNAQQISFQAVSPNTRDSGLSTQALFVADAPAANSDWDTLYPDSLSLKETNLPKAVGEINLDWDGSVWVITQPGNTHNLENPRISGGDLLVDISDTTRASTISIVTARSATGNGTYSARNVAIAAGTVTINISKINPSTLTNPISSPSSGEEIRVAILLF